MLSGGTDMKKTENRVWEVCQMVYLVGHKTANKITIWISAIFV